jgi:hypothetical protein
MSSADIFQHKVNTILTDSDRGHFMQFHERVQFKLDAAAYFLDKLKELKKKADSLVGPDIKRHDVELNLDAFLYEIVGALDPLLQEINVAFRLCLKPQEVKISKIIPKLPEGSQLKKTLGKADGDTQGWFWMLREYRNHSAHRKIIGFSIFIGGAEDGEVYLHKDPLDTSKGRTDEEVVQYCHNSIKRMEYLIDKIYGLCATELSSSKSRGHL